MFLETLYHTRPDIRGDRPVGARETQKGTKPLKRAFLKQHPLFCLVLFLQTLGWGGVAMGGAVNPPAHIRIKGSDTMASLTMHWAKTYQSRMPNVTMEVTAGGSGNGIAALLNGHVEIANTSRLLKSQEVRQMTRRSWKQPVMFVVGLDAVSVIVHPLNPLNGVSLRQLGEIYGRKGTIRRWRDMGINVPGCEERNIVRVSRKNNSGTYRFFRDDIFSRRRHFHINLEVAETSEDVVQKVAETPCAIGYSGMSFVTVATKTLCITEGNDPCVPPTPAFTRDKSYPLARPLFMVTLGPPKGVVKEYVQWVIGPEGQRILRKFGFVSAPSQQEAP